MKYFRSNTIYKQSPSTIDKELGIIKGIKICQPGEAKGHNIKLNTAFIEKVVKLGNESQAGVKARFGHPNICSTALGTYLGRYKNFRINDAVAYADLHLDKSAKKSPKGNLFEYVLELAETNPDMFGASIAFKAGKPIIEFETIGGEKKEIRYATIKSLHACDMVDDPAATDGLFEEGGHPELVEGGHAERSRSVHADDFSYQVSVFLDEHPEIYKLLDKKPEILNEFLLNYNNNKTNKTMSITEEINKLKTWVTDNFSKNGNSPLPSEMSNLSAGALAKEEGQRGEELKADFNSQITALEAKLKSQEPPKGLMQIYADQLLSITDFAATHKFDKEKDVLEQATSKIEQLESDLNRSKANATLPSDTTDPLLNLKNGEADKSGKALLNQLPNSVKRKLKQ